MWTTTCALSSEGPAGLFGICISILLSAGLGSAMEERKCCRVQQVTQQKFCCFCGFEPSN